MTVTDTTHLPAGTWVVDPTHSQVEFTVRHLGLSKVRGRFGTFEGSVSIADDLSASEARATIDMSSIDTNNPDRDAHLRSTDFFDTETNPTMVFESSAVRGAGTDWQVDGSLTINGVTRPVTLDVEFHGVAEDPYGQTKAGFSATARINRKDFGVDFNVPLAAGGLLIGEKIDVELEIQVVHQA